MINITCYTNNSDNNVINKTLVNPREYGITLKDQCTIKNPYLLLATTDNITAVNYCYIPDFNRYYFVEVEHIRNGLWGLRCTCDVLESYKAGILSRQAVVSRQTGKYNLYLSDSFFEVYADNSVVTKEFPSGFESGGQFYMTVAGGYK